jgi:RimJ/RimL family protein N-acetyltransferase
MIRSSIVNSTLNDIEAIFRLYDIAVELQKKVGTVHWPEFERAFIETEIKEHRQWKLIIDGEIACVWATTFTDPQIWEERNADPSVYIHRIATIPAFRGKDLVAQIVGWAKGYAKENGRKYIRLDTVGNNEKLIHHYRKCGFNYLGMVTLKTTEGLPHHYTLGGVCLFEITV